MIDFAEIRGQAPAIEALITAIAAGERRVLLVGPPGTARTMIARRIPTVLPPLTEHERVWLQAEYDGLDLPFGQRIQIDSPPFQAPHYTVSPAGLVGLPSRGTDPAVWPVRFGGLPGGWLRSLPPSPVPRAGSAQLARFGVLMLDEFEEFSAPALQSLARRLDQMAGAPFVAATATPCPCGWHGSGVRECVCLDLSRASHSIRVAKHCAWLRIETNIALPALPLGDLRNLPPGESSASLRARIEAMRAGRTTEGTEP